MKHMVIHNGREINPWLYGMTKFYDYGDKEGNNVDTGVRKKRISSLL